MSNISSPPAISNMSDSSVNETLGLSFSQSTPPIIRAALIREIHERSHNLSFCTHTMQQKLQEQRNFNTLLHSLSATIPTHSSYKEFLCRHVTLCEKIQNHSSFCNELIHEAKFLMNEMKMLNKWLERVQPDMTLQNLDH
jgi:hypothetical protein